MADTKFSRLRVTGVQTTSETRADLTKIVKIFRDEGKDAVPVLFGSHRKAEGVIMPMWMWEELLERLDSVETELVVLQRKDNPQLSEPMTSAQFVELSNKWFAEFEKLNDANNPTGPGVPRGPSEP
jgi:antitoxin StbD